MALAAKYNVQDLQDIWERWQRNEISSEEAKKALRLHENGLLHVPKEHMEEIVALAAELKGTPGVAGGRAPGQLKTARDLLDLLAADLAFHLDGVLVELRKVAEAGVLDDTYRSLVDEISSKSGRSPDLVEILENAGSLGPSLQAALDALKGARPQAPPKGQGPDPGDADGDELWRRMKGQMAIGRYDDALALLDRFAERYPDSGDHYHSQDIDSVRQDINEARTMGLSPQLGDCLGKMPSAIRAGRTTGQWMLLEQIERQANTALDEITPPNGLRPPMPPMLRSKIEEAGMAKLAQQAVKEAREYRRKGDFVTAAGRLKDAEDEDPQILQIEEERAIVDYLHQQWRTLRPKVFTTSTSIPELVAARIKCEELLDHTNGAPESDDIVDRKGKINEVIAQLVKSSHASIDRLKLEIDGAGDIKARLDKIGATTNPSPGTLRKYLDDFRTLDPMNTLLQAELSWAADTQRDLDSLLREKGELLSRITSINPAIVLSVEQLQGIIDDLSTLEGKPRASGDPQVKGAGKALQDNVTKYLADRAKRLTDLPSMKNYHDILDKVSTYRSWAPGSVDSYLDELWASASAQVSLHLPQTLPPYQQGQLRSSTLISNWSTAREILEWLRNIPSAVRRAHVVQTLDKQYANSVDRMLESLGQINVRMPKAEQQERAHSSKEVFEFARTLSEPIRSQIMSLKRRKPIAQQIVDAIRWGRWALIGSGIVIVLLLIAWQARANWPTIAAVINPPTPVPTGTATPVFRQPIEAFFAPEQRIERPSCQFIATSGNLGFNVCNATEQSTTYFNDYYSDPIMSQFLGAPISKQFQDLEVAGRWVQYFEKGRLEQAYYDGKPRAELGRLGDDLLKSMSGAKPALMEARVERSQPQSGCAAVEKYPHWLCGDFLNFFRGSLGAVGAWNPVDYYGGALSEEYTDSVNGVAVRRQFLERAILQRRNNAIEAVPVGVLYANWVRQLNITPSDKWKGVVDAGEVKP